jgi:hypothetical protein
MRQIQLLNEGLRMVVQEKANLMFYYDDGQIIRLRFSSSMMALRTYRDNVFIPTGSNEEDVFFLTSVVGVDRFTS